MQPALHADLQSLHEALSSSVMLTDQLPSVYAVCGTGMHMLYSCCDVHNLHCLAFAADNDRVVAAADLQKSLSLLGRFIQVFVALCGASQSFEMLQR